MTCREFADFLMDYLDGYVADDARAQFEAHLAECPDCIAYLATYEQTIRLGKAICREDHEAAPPKHPEELVRAIVAACRL